MGWNRSENLPMLWPLRYNYQWLTSCNLYTKWSYTSDMWLYINYKPCMHGTKVVVSTGQSDQMFCSHSDLRTLEWRYQNLCTMSSDSTHSLILSPSCCSGVSPLTLRYGNELAVEVVVGEPVSRGFCVSSLYVVELGPGLTLAPSEVKTSSDVGLLPPESSCLPKGGCLVVWGAAAETTVARLDN